MRDDAASPPLAEQFRRFGIGAGRDGAPLYARLSQGVAGDPELLALLAGAPADQRRPNLLLAAVHDLLLAGADDPLAAHYQTVAAWRDEPAGRAGPDPFGDFVRFCRRHRDQIAARLAVRATQTNEVGRCTALLPALAAVAGRAGRPLAVVDLGAAAGLNLLFDRYGYDYGTATAGVADSPVRLRCQLRAGMGRAAPVPTGLPPVAARVGLDRRPVDPRDAEGARWLLACQWPDHVERFRTLAAALELARGDPDRPDVIPADILDDLGPVVNGMPAGAHLCLVHTWVAAYLTPAEQARLGAAIADLGARRPVSWVFAENPYEVPTLPMPPPPGDPVRAATALVLVDHVPEARPVARRLGDMHPHGRWLHWYGAGSGGPAR